MDDENIEIPQYFVCPISLQIMKDPVTTVTGITYDRESIHQWLATTTTTTGGAAVCPVTKQPLTQPPDLTPNHMLRRLIQAWCVANAIDRIPTPKSPLQKSVVIKLIRDVSNKTNTILNLDALKKLEKLAEENDRINKKCMSENGVAKSLILFVLRCFQNVQFLGLDQAFRILKLTWAPSQENKQVVEENYAVLFQTVLWVLNSSSGSEYNNSTDALVFLKNVAGVMTSSSMERLNPSFFKEIIKFMKKKNIPPQATKSILKILISICHPARNKLKILEAGAVTDLVEMELNMPEKKTTELIFCLLAHLCTCAEGRQQFLGHAGGVAVVAKRLLRVSPATDDRALCILESVARSAATRGVVLEILAVGGVSKLCMVLQAECEGYLKKKAREILRLHSKAWSNSPCIQLYLFTRYT